MNIRFATKKDEFRVIELKNELQEISGAPRVSLKDSLFREILKNKNCKIFLVECEGQIIGLASFYMIPKITGYRAMVEDFIVTEEERGKGLGSFLLGGIKKYCQENHIKVLNIASGFETKKAHKFYEKNGGQFRAKQFKFYL